MGEEVGTANQPRVAEAAVGWVTSADPSPKKFTSSRGAGGATKPARKTLTLQESNGLVSGSSESISVTRTRGFFDRE